MTRKDASFGQLVDYLHKEEPVVDQLLGYINKDSAQSSHVQTLLYNLPGVAPDDIQGITETFKENDAFRHERKNGVVQYHEVISFSPKDRDVLARHPEILMDMARKYLDLRAPHSLAIARPHFDAEHIHVHLMISGNQYRSSETTRISQRVFDQVKEHLNEYQLHQYPELSNSIIKEHQVADPELKKSLPIKEERKEKEVTVVELNPEETPVQETVSSRIGLAAGTDDSAELVLEPDEMPIPSPYWNDDDSEEAIPSPYWDTDDDSNTDDDGSA
jgi:hypothetical protein